MRTEAQKYQYRVAFRLRFWVNGQECLMDHSNQNDAYKWLDQNESFIDNWSGQYMEVKRSEFLKVPVYRISGIEVKFN